MFENQNPDDALKFSVGKLGKDYRLSRNFRLWEAQCSDGSDIVFVHPSILILVQALRDEFGALRVNSWYRTPSFNATLAGKSSKTSKHLLGMAVDLYPLKHSLESFKTEVNQLPVGGIGIYETFVHLDVFGEGRKWKG